LKILYSWTNWTASVRRKHQRRSRSQQERRWLAGLGQFKELLENRGCGVAIMDLTWCGGISEARRISALVEAAHTSVAFHDCTGPIALAASTHMALNAENCFVQEMVRAFYYGWYGDLVTQLPPVEKGRIRAPEGAGLGLELNADRLAQPDVHIRRSDA
jgi:L-alanine-DL-glutamate epimerase-like enolase superfamily enzyme